MKTFRGIVREALEAVQPVMEAGLTAWDADELAQLIEIGLRGEGLRLHDVEKCEERAGRSYPPLPPDVGRPLTREIVVKHGRSPAAYGFE